jgi:hypothetical protein
MLIGQEIPLIIIPPRVIVSYLVILSSLGIARNNLLLPALALKLSIVILLIPPLSSSGSVGHMIWVFLSPPILISFVTIEVRFRLRIMMYFIHVLNTLKSTVFLCTIIFCKELSISVLLLSLISWSMYSPKHIHLDGS